MDKAMKILMLSERIKSREGLKGLFPAWMEHTTAYLDNLNAKDRMLINAMRMGVIS